LTEVELPQAQVLGELVMEPLNKALQEENGNLKAENRVLKEREICKQELMDEYKARAKNMEEENQRSKEENQQLKEEVSSLKEKDAATRVEIEYLKRRDEQLRVENEYFKRKEEEWRLERNTDRAERTAERAMFQAMISNLMNGTEDRKRKRNDDEESK
jgi:RNA recognition motif-containing protein